VCVIDDPLSLSKYCPNLRSLQIDHWSEAKKWNNNSNEKPVHNWNKPRTINDGTRNLTLKLLGTPLYLTSLTSLTMNIFTIKLCSDGLCGDMTLSMLIVRLTQAPALEYLKLINAHDFDYRWLDLLHQNTPKLMHLKLEKINYVFAFNEYLQECTPLLMDQSVTSSLCSLNIIFKGIDKIESCHKEMNSAHWMFYISRKYSSLTSISLSGIPVCKWQDNIDLVSSYLQDALRSWKQLKKFNMQHVFLSVDILNVMDDYNSCLEDLTVHIAKNMDMMQFSNLKRSKLGRRINNLTIYNHTKCKSIMQNWNLADYTRLITFMKTLDTKYCQLKTLNVSVDFDCHDHHLNIITPIQLLDCMPSSVQTLSMYWVGAKDEINSIYPRMNSLRYLYLEICQKDDYHD
jgi:hypothetical protein